MVLSVDFILINSILIIIIFFLLVVLTFVSPPDSPWAPWWRTPAHIARIMCQLARVGKKDVVYELGSGDGTAVITAVKEFGAKGVGIEIEFTRFLISKLLARLQNVSNVRFVKDNFYHQNLSEATVIFFYLVPRVIKNLIPKLKKELRPGTRIVSFVYEADLPLVRKDIKNRIYVYKIPKRNVGDI